MNKRELATLLIELVYVDPDFQVFVHKTKNNPVGYLCVANNQVLPAHLAWLETVLVSLNTVVDGESILAIDLSEVAQ